MKNFRDEELKKWLAEEYYREADEMERILFPDGNIPEYEETEEETKAAYARLVERLKADGIYEEENNSYETDGHRGKNLKDDEKIKIVYLPARKQNRFVRVAAILAICVAGVFAAGMTSQANRSYFIDSVRYWVGDDTKIVIDTDKNSDVYSVDEDNAIANIKEQLGIDVPYLMYRPNGLEFKNYKVSKDFEYAILEYQYNDKILSIYINKYNNANKSSGASLDGKEIGTIELDKEDVAIQIKKIKAKGDKQPTYIAYWITSSEFYQVECQMKEKEFIKVIRNIKF